MPKYSNLKFRRAKAEEASLCAPYIARASQELLKGVFSLAAIHEEDFIAFDFKRGRGVFGYEYIYIAEHDSEILGIVTLYPGQQYKRLARASLGSILRFYGFKSVLILFRMLGLRTVFSEPADDCIFIANAYVTESHRNSGVYSSLIYHAKELAQKQGLQALECDVSFRNQRSFEVHKALGFDELKRNAYQGNNEHFDGFIRMRASL